MSFNYFLKERNFNHYFQPIYDLISGNKIGDEALIRSSVYSNPNVIFQEAEKKDRLYELDSRSIHKAFSTYHSAGLQRNNEKLFLNVLPSTMLKQNFPRFLYENITSKYQHSQQIVLEISESETIDDLEAFKKSVAAIRKQGVLLAIDDVGKGYTHIQTMIELELDYLKLDRYFSHNLHLSEKKQTVIFFFVHYCHKYKIKLIIEGLENIEELKTAKALGIHLGQGYLLGKPATLRKELV